MKESDYIAATNLAHIQGANMLLHRCALTSDANSDKVLQAMRLLTELEVDLGKTAHNKPESEPPGVYTPDTVSPPGETIRELMAERGMSTDELQNAIGPVLDVSWLLDGQIHLMPALARRLEQIFDVPAQVWLNLDAAYVRWLESKNA